MGGYNRGNDATEKETAGNQPLREIFADMVKSRKPLVLHNGLIDLVFLYHNFWAALPTQLGTFISDIIEMFPAGLYDTKYTADYVSRTQASFLEFVFRKEQKTNAERCDMDRPHVKLVFDQEEMDGVEWRLCGLRSDPGASEEPEVCFSYAQHGHCPAGNSCKQSHNIDSIIKQKGEEQDRKRRKRTNEDEEKGHKQALDETNRDKDSTKDAPTTAANSGGHRAGYDAFMTAFSFSTFLVHQTQLPVAPDSFWPAGIKADKLANRIYLVCKDFPLLVQKSAFAKCSVQHDQKMRRLGLNDNSGQ